MIAHRSLSKDRASLEMRVNGEISKKEVFRSGTLETSSATAWITAYAASFNADGVGQLVQ